VHDIRSIWKVLDWILRNIMNLVPNVLADGKILEIITEPIKDHLRVIPEITRVPFLRIQHLPQDVVQHIVIGL
jgi:hypothetical protein